VKTTIANLGGGIY